MVNNMVTRPTFDGTPCEDFRFDRILEEPVHLALNGEQLFLDWGPSPEPEPNNIMFAWEGNQTVVHNLPKFFDPRSRLTENLVDVGLLHTVLGELAYHNPARYGLKLAPAATGANNPLFEHTMVWGDRWDRVMCDKIVPPWVQNFAGLGWFNAKANPETPYTAYLRPVVTLVGMHKNRVKEVAGVTVVWEVRQVGVDDGEAGDATIERCKHLARFDWDDDEAFASALTTLSYDPESLATLRALSDPDSVTNYIQTTTFWRNYQKIWEAAEPTSAQVNPATVTESINKMRQHLVELKVVGISMGEPIGLGGDHVTIELARPSDMSRRNIAIPLYLERVDEQTMVQLWLIDVDYKRMTKILVPHLQTNSNHTIVRSRIDDFAGWSYYVVANPQVFAQSYPFLLESRQIGIWRDTCLTEQFVVDNNTWVPITSEPLPPH